MTEEQVREIVRQAIAAERTRTANILRGASAEFSNNWGNVSFDFEASMARIATAIESEEG